MAQKGLPFLSKVGVSQHWFSAWDCYKTELLTRKQLWLIEEILDSFISNRSSLSAGLVDFNFDFCWNQFLYWDCEIPEEEDWSALGLIIEQRIKRGLPIFVGRIIFLKLQTWIIIIVFIFKPCVGKSRYKGPKTSITFGRSTEQALQTSMHSTNYSFLDTF